MRFRARKIAWFECITAGVQDPGTRPAGLAPPGQFERVYSGSVSADPSAWPTVTERLVAWLTAADVPFRILHHPPVRTSAEAATVRGTALEAGAKALVVQADDRPVHVVLPADRRVDNARLRALLHARRLRFVTPDELQALTGCAPGAVPPFGNLFGLDVLVDEELTRLDEIAFNAGSREISLTMRCADFLRLAGARVVRFAQT
jgi:prolyl-tRNA editing enzyme YbaK/EbsC (Cys-tRNA(Pro) deacylase)